MISLALNIISFIFLLAVGYWVFLIVIGILGSMFSGDNGAGTEYGSTTNKKSIVKFTENPLPKNFDILDFERALSKYNTDINNIASNPNAVRSIALGFDDIFKFRYRIFQFLLFLYDSFWNQTYVTEAKSWWPNYLPPLRNIKVERSGGSEVNISIKIKDILINYHQKESGETYSVNKNENEVEITYKKKEVYRALFYTSGLYSFGKQNIVPEEVNLYLFKPSEWLYTLHSLLCKYEQEHSQIIKLKFDAIKRLETERQKANFQA